MKKIKQFISVITVLLGLHGCVGVSPDGRGYTVAVPLNIINNSVSQSFPQKQETGYGTLLINKPNILGKKSEQTVGVGTSFAFSNMLIPQGIKGSLSLSSGLRYNPSDRGLYLSAPMVDELTFQNFSLSQYLTPQIRQVIGSIIVKTLIKKPIYRLNNLGSSFVKGVGIENGNLMVTLGL